jgi:hypothetical protein
MSEACETCRWWVLVQTYPDIPDIKADGQCRRHPPHARSGFPLTDCDIWCGEWETKGEANGAV